MKQTFTKVFLSILCLFSAINSQALVYTVAGSGNFSDPATWLGGVVPPVPLGANDIIIGGGYTVTLDRNLILSNTNSLVQLQANSRIQSTGNNYIVLSSGTLTGDMASVIDLDSVFFGNTLIQYSGSITGDKITFAGTNIPSGITVNADEYLYFTSGLTNLQSGVNINLSTGSPRPTIVMDGGSFIIPLGVNFNLTVPYNVRFQQASVAIGSGAELTGTGLADIEIAIGNGNNVALDADLVASGLLKLTSGSLALTNSSFKLIMAGNSSFDPGGTGNIQGNTTAEVVITSSAANLGTVRFANGSAELKTLDMKAANSSAELKLGSSLSITGTLNLQSGRINVQDKTLTIVGGLGSIAGGSANSYIITEANGQLKQDIAANAFVTYPIGHASAYTPVILTDQKGANMLGMNMNVQKGVKDQGTSGTDMAATKPLVDATWTTSMSGNPFNLDYKIELMWSAGSEVNSFDRNKCFVAMYENKWNNAAGAAAGTSGSLYTAQKSNITRGGTFAVLDENTLNIRNIATSNSIAMFPNPAKGVLNIPLKDNATATLYNTTGQVVLITEISNSNNTIDISNLVPGVYYVQLRGADGNSNARFVKE